MEAPASESPIHALLFPAWAAHADLGEEVALDVTEPLIVSGSMQRSSILHLSLVLLTDTLRLLSAAGDFSPSLSSLFPTVLAGDFVHSNHSDDL